MNRALYAAASGMRAEQENLDTIAANLANADVTGFASRMSTFRSQIGNDGRIIGVASAGTHLQFTQGKCEKSTGPCDVAIHGNGFFRVQRGAEIGFTRDGSFHCSPQGNLENADGWHVVGVRLPLTSGTTHVENDGYVSVRDAQGRSQTAGRITLADFSNPECLQMISPTIYGVTAASGPSHCVNPGSAGGPEIMSGVLERSSVTIAESMMEILDAQRAYEADAKGVQAADETVRIANNLQRG